MGEDKLTNGLTYLEKSELGADRFPGFYKTSKRYFSLLNFIIAILSGVLR